MPNIIVTVMTNDPLGRWKKWEEGILLENDFEKYDYFVELKRKAGSKMARNYYFYKEEVSLHEHITTEQD